MYVYHGNTEHKIWAWMENMMANRCLRKGLVLAIIFLFIGREDKKDDKAFQLFTELGMPKNVALFIFFKWKYLNNIKSI